MNDISDQFEADCRAKGINTEIALAVREAIAKVIRSEPSALSFQTPTREIIKQANRVRVDGWDDLAFVLAFEETTGWSLRLDTLRLPQIVPGRFFFWKTEGAKTFGEWCESVVPVLMAATNAARN